MVAQMSDQMAMMAAAAVAARFSLNVGGKMINYVYDKVELVDARCQSWEVLRARGDVQFEPVSVSTGHSYLLAREGLPDGGRGIASKVGGGGDRQAQWILARLDPAQ